ncbi:hypothetical protein IWZ00DRAFT_114434 [Phyllosticta capitalensis]
MLVTVLTLLCSLPRHVLLLLAHLSIIQKQTPSSTFGDPESQSPPPRLTSNNATQKSRTPTQVTPAPRPAALHETMLTRLNCICSASESATARDAACERTTYVPVFPISRHSVLCLLSCMCLCVLHVGMHACKPRRGAARRIRYGLEANAEPIVDLTTREKGIVDKDATSFLPSNHLRAYSLFLNRWRDRADAAPPPTALQ